MELWLRDKRQTTDRGATNGLQTEGKKLDYRKRERWSRYFATTDGIHNEGQQTDYKMKGNSWTTERETLNWLVWGTTDRLHTDGRVQIKWTKLRNNRWTTDLRTSDGLLTKYLKLTRLRNNRQTT